MSHVAISARLDQDVYNKLREIVTTTGHTQTEVISLAVLNLHESGNCPAFEPSTDSEEFTKRIRQQGTSFAEWCRINNTSPAAIYYIFRARAQGKCPGRRQGSAEVHRLLRLIASVQ